MNSLVAVILVFGGAIFIHEFGHFLMGKLAGVRVEKFSIGLGPRLFGIKRGETDYCLSLVPFGGYVAFAGEEKEGEAEPYEFKGKPPGVRARIIVAGVTMNFVAAFLIVYILFGIGAQMPAPCVGGLLEGMPAEKAGLQKGDWILAVDDKPIKTWFDLQDAVRESGGHELLLQVKRGEEVLQIKVKPQHHPVAGYAIGIYMDSEATVFVKYGFLKGLPEAGREIGRWVQLIGRALRQILARQVPVREGLTGPVGIMGMTAVAAKEGVRALLAMAALINLSLGIFNLLPLPVLDGGALLFVAIERVRKKPISIKVQQIATNVMMVLLIMLFLYVTYWDIVRLGVAGKVTQAIKGVLGGSK